MESAGEESELKEQGYVDKRTVLEIFTGSNHIVAGDIDISEDNAFFGRYPRGFDRVYIIASPNDMADGPETHEAQFYGHIAAV